MKKSTTRTYERFSLVRRLEHWIYVLSFITLAMTGLPQKYPNAGISIGFVQLLGGIENLRSVHHAAAIALMVGTVWHLLYFGFVFYVRRVRMTILPTFQDAKDALQSFMYNLGFTKKYPQMGRYTFEEKMEYWSLVWGTTIMVVTGFMMWNPISTTKFLPGQFIPAAKAAHGAEAVLAVLAILIWHMYSVHIKRFNKAMFTGKVDEDHMLHDHPMELADIKAGIAAPQVDPLVLRKRQFIYYPIAAVLAVLLLGGVYGFVNAEDTALGTTERQIPTIQVYVPQTPTPAPTQTPTAVPTQPPVGYVPLWQPEIKALFASMCTECHNTDGEAGLNLTTYDSTMKGSDSGQVIFPGNSEGSLLIKIQSSGKHYSTFTTEQLNIIIMWIDADAPRE